ncbi:MAG: hypothetical protein CL679_12505 [Bermanella sp.]|nr:hypothetical protein [Bermanella sp.]|tara:strand:+ start:1817 stop:2527 length:711 start_codon:yes stop_codon:yes gene_type:complete
MQDEFILNHVVWNYVAFVVFVCVWVGYSYFAKYMAKRTHCLASVLDLHRVSWMERMMLRENRIGDAALLANLERNVNFMASTTVIIVAAVLTALTSASKWVMLESVGSDFNHYKLGLLLFIMVYAFFSFTWSLRQYGFGSVLVGAAPMPDQDQFNARQRKEYAYSTGKILDQAGHAFNYGLRAYYFAMATLAWFIHPVLFMLATFLVVSVLYRREFSSKALKLLVMDADILEGKIR